MTDKNNLAQDRTNWAEDRTILANERTFAGWMRTGMASLAIAVGLKAVFGDFDPTWMAKSVATLFVVTAVLIFWAAALQSCKTQTRINSHSASPQSSTRIVTLAVIMSVGAIGTGAILWLL